MPQQADVRRGPFIKVAGHLAIEMLPPLWPVRLVDVSWTGFLTLSARPFPIGTCVRARFGHYSGLWSGTLHARAVHCRVRTAAGVSPKEFATGFVFTELDVPDVVEKVDALLDLAVGVYEFDWGSSAGHRAVRAAHTGDTVRRA